MMALSFFANQALSTGLCKRRSLLSEREQVKIFDTTLRDGEQSPGCSMTSREKLRMAHELDHLGVDVIEAGFPVASSDDFQAVLAVGREIRRPVIAALARCCREDIEEAWRALEATAHPRIHLFLATSDIHLNHKLKISRQQCLEQAWQAVRLAKSFCKDIEFSPEDATRSNSDFLCQMLAVVIEAGVTTVNIPDTVGYAVPSDFVDLIQTIRHRVPGIEQVQISAHCHDDLGLAVANSLAAISAGARQVECTINGIGERAGNASLEEIVMAMRVRPDRYPYQTAVVSEKLFPVSQRLSETIGMQVQPNKAVIGRNAFAHEAGIHQDGMIKNPLTYEIMTPQSVGVPSMFLILGKHSGRHALGLRCEQLGFKLCRQELDLVYRRFLALADNIKNVEDHHILDLIGETPSDSRTAETTEGNSAGQSRPGRAVQLNPTNKDNGRVDATASLTASGDESGQQEDYLWGV
jgi:2-isopropylmalate synthase